MDNKVKKEKKMELILGLFLMIPPVLGVISFTLCLFGIDGDFTENFIKLRNLSSGWSNNGSTPIYMGIMALAGAYLVKGNMKYLINDDVKD